MNMFFRLTGAEFQKIIRQPVAIVFLAVAIAFVCYFTLGWTINKNEFMPDLGTDLNVDTYTLLESLRARAETASYSGRGDEEIFVEAFGRSYKADDIYIAVTRMDYLLTGESNRLTYIGSAQRNVEGLSGNPKTLYAMRYNAAIRDALSARGKPALMSGDYQARALLVLGGGAEVNFFDAMLMLLCIASLCSLFPRDLETKTEQITLPTRHGANTLFFSKFSAGFLFIAGAQLLFLVMAFVLFGTRTGYETFLAPIHSISTFEMTMYDLDFLTLWLAIWGLKTLFSLFLFSFFSFFGLLLKNRFPAMIFGLLCYGGLYYLSSNFESLSAPFTTETSYFQYMLNKWGHMLNPANLSGHPAGYFTSFQYVNIFGYPVKELSVAMALTAFLLLLFTGLCFRLYGKTGRRDRRLFKMRFSRAGL